jgi:hypothetical protein
MSIYNCSSAVHHSVTSNFTSEMLIINTSLQILSSLYISSVLHLRSGDIHPNPGPTYPDSESVDSFHSSYCNILNSGLSILHLNIQSLKRKIDILQVESQAYDILVFTETWLNKNISNEELFIQNFQPPYRCDRIGRTGGGVAIYVRDNIIAIERSDLFVNGLEALWLEVKISQRKILLGGIYRPPDSNNEHWQAFKHSSICKIT